MRGTGDLGAALPVPDAGRHAVAPMDGLDGPGAAAPHARPVQLLLCRAALPVLRVAGHGFRRRRHRARHPEAPLRARRHAGLAADGPAGRDLVQPRHQGAGGGPLAAIAPPGACHRAARSAALLLDAQREEQLRRSRGVCRHRGAAARLACLGRVGRAQRGAGTVKAQARVTS